MKTTSTAEQLFGNEIMTKAKLTSSRKMDHLRICSQENIETGTTLFDDVHLVHCALPECDMDAIDLSVEFLGKRLGSPLFIAAMTGGHPDTAEVNRVLAAAAEKYRLGIGVGSQRAALEKPELADSFAIVRETAPHAFVCGNLGAVQLAEHGAEWAERAVEMIEADALCIHLNFLQEVIQPEGDRSAVGCLEAIRQCCKDVKFPIIVKETGNGISREVASQLWDAGVAAIDTGGVGGTSWAKIEGIRADERGAAGDKALRELGDSLLTWGIPTALSVFEVAGTRKGPVIATGGLRSGLDIAKGIALGATLGGMALPLLSPALSGEEETYASIDSIHYQLRAAMFLTGSADVSALQSARTYITGTLREMTLE
ncbi:Isopentenyl-diphosphate delta-isomerase [Methanocorpusculaceae archaeon Cs1]|uniref:Isopentenyl-diphosphate delta-isomerase n=2 Tax=Methanorbis rubei TaxID=3028300 RepID=A0AAE4MF08_9EURY|nr:Isopentenyl-diphosphate delta-isomerase [Methanocorpusculaceae archaeon Cs1]